MATILKYLAILTWAAQRPDASQQGSGRVDGRVVDSVSQNPVTVVEVTLRGTALTTVTDLDGRFAFRRVPAGWYVLEARRVGYQPLVHDTIRVRVDSTITVALTMAPLAFRLGEVTVTPGSFSFLDAGPTTRQAMSRAEIESAPFGEDLFRAVGRLPGLSSGDYSAHFSIRGGRHDETLILLDGLEIYEPYHLKDFNEGALSIVDVGTIDGVELLTGGFPAKFGDKRSGVFRITSRTPKGPGARFNAGLSFTNAHALAEGTFAESGSWLVSARRGYVDLVLGLINKNELPSPRYEDLFATFRYRVHPRHTLALNVLHAGDRYTYNANSTTGFADAIRTREIADNRYGNSYLWLTLGSLVGRRFAVQTVASAGRITAGRDGTERYLDRPGAHYVVTNTRDFSVLGFKQEWTYERSNAMLVEFGYDVRRLNADYLLTSDVGQNPDDPAVDTLGFYPQRTSTVVTRPGTTIGAWLSSRVQPFDPLTIEVGLRYDRGSYTHDRDVSPRLNALLRLSDRSSLRAGFGHHRQRQGIADLNALDGLNRYFPSELSKQWTLGFEHLFTDGGTVRAESYYKTGSRLRPIYRNWKGGIDVFPESNEDRILVFPDRTTSKGIELYHHRDLGRRWSIRAGYALAFTEEHTARIDNVNDSRPIAFDRTHPTPQDQRHALNLDLVYRPGQTWTINTSYAFHTGWPATTESILPVRGPNGEPDAKVTPNRLYASRLPAYHRVDVRLTRRKPTKGGEFRFFVEVINLTNHRNVLGYDYFRVRDVAGGIGLQRSLESWFTILPSLGVSWSRRL